MPATRQSIWATAVALAWCSGLAWYAFVRGVRVPLLGLADFGIHELGHFIGYILDFLLPFPEILVAGMGSGLQVLAPLGLAAYFGLRRGDRLAAGVMLAWAGTSMQDASIYIADAPYEQLELVGGEHDWAYVLGPEQLDMLDSAGTIGDVVRVLGMMVLVAGALLIVARHLRGGVTGLLQGDPPPPPVDVDPERWKPIRVADWG